MNKKLFPLMSGGVDSTIAILKRISQRDFYEVQPVFINYGQRACEQEWNAVRKVSFKIAELIRESDVKFLDPVRIDLSSGVEGGLKIFQWSESKLITGNRDATNYVENRNMVLLSVITSFAESRIRKFEEAIVITGFRDEFADTKREFVQLVNCVLSFLLRDEEKLIRIEAPIIDYGPAGKKKMVEDYRKYKEIIKLTWSCYTPLEDQPCHICRACRGRKQAFKGVIEI